jgi:hypothetical protein
VHLYSFSIVGFLFQQLPMNGVQMKHKSILIVILFTLTSFNLNAQTLVNYGLKFGVAASNPIWKVESTSISGIKTLYGADIGLFADWSLSKYFFITSELHYVQKGLKTQFDGERPISDSERPTINYLSIPITIKYVFLDSYIEPYVLGGPRVDFAISKYDHNWSRFVYKNTKDIDFGINVGLGIQTKSLIGIGTGIELRYCPSLINVDSSIMGNITNRSYEINLFVYR